jgi:hypothetical protein
MRNKKDSKNVVDVNEEDSDQPEEISLSTSKKQTIDELTQRKQETLTAKRYQQLLFLFPLIY